MDPISRSTDQCLLGCIPPVYSVKTSDPADKHLHHHSVGSCCCWLLLGHPTYMLVDLCFTTIFLSFFRPFPSELAGRNSTKISHMVGSECDLKMLNWNLGYPSTNRGPQTHLFRRLGNLIATLTAYIFGMNIDIHKRVVLCKLHGVSYIVSKRHELWSTNGLKLEVHFYLPSVNSAFYFIARLCIWRSVNGTQPNCRQ